MDDASFSIRPATADDAVAIAGIYNEAVRTTTATFDTQPQSVDQRRRWLAARDERHPVFVAEVDGQVVGWASLSKWSDRPAYDQTVESSFYVGQAFRGRGIGRALKQRQVEAARQLGFHSIIARAAQGSDASLHLNLSVGFRHIGTMKQVGFKFGRWLDVHMMQLMINPHANQDSTVHAQAAHMSDTDSDPAAAGRADQRLVRERFPRSSQYHPDWVIANAMGSNVLWLTEWLAEAIQWRPEMRVLDLGCGRAASSIFLAREFGAQVWATDLWISASENTQRIRDAGLSDRVFPLHADARALPFAAGFFDAIVCVDAFSYFGTDDLYLHYLANFVKLNGQIGVAGAGLAQEIETVPDHLQAMWTQDFWCLHSAAWWRRHWERTGIVDIQRADSMTEAWQAWLDWQSTAHPDNTTEIETVKADQGRYLSYVRVVGRRREEAELEQYCWPDTMRSFPAEYQRLPHLREDAG